MRTHVYVDGFNLYYGCLKGTPWRWLDLRRMCQLLLPENEVVSIKYFTALVNARPGDPGQPVRQQTYLRALRSLPQCEVILGHFLKHRVRMPLAAPTEEAKFALVVKTEEKGSDVNIATHMLRDAFMDAYDVAVIVSNDSDLVGPVRVVAEDLNKTVGILNPRPHPSRELAKHVAFFKRIRKGVLAASQFPDQLCDATGPFHKPNEW